MTHRRSLRRLASVLGPVVLALLLSEAAIRILGETDENGQFWLMGRRLQPYRLPLASVARTLDRYAGDDSSYLTYDPEVGWRPRGGGRSADGLYVVNSAGVRSDREYPLTPPAGRLRIAIFGDSYTHGDQVTYPRTWGRQLEALLRARDIDAEVLNFGVGAYGMDQAYLRWRSQGRDYSPAVVVFGFTPIDIPRNLKIFRILHSRRTDIPFSKPRFVLENGGLRLVNSPTVPVERIVETLRDFATSPLAAHDDFYEPAKYADRWWLRSRLAALALYVLEPRDRRSESCRDLDEEPARLTLAILDRFARDVEADGGRFLVAHLPPEAALRDHRRDGRFCYQDLLDEIARRHALIRTEDAFRGELAPYFIGHYSAAGNAAVAGAVADAIASDAGAS